HTDEAEIAGAVGAVGEQAFGVAGVPRTPVDVADEADLEEGARPTVAEGPPKLHAQLQLADRENIALVGEGLALRGEHAGGVAIDGEGGLLAAAEENREPGIAIQAEAALADAGVRVDGDGRAGAVEVVARGDGPRGAVGE